MPVLRPRIKPPKKQKRSLKDAIEGEIISNVKFGHKLYDAEVIENFPLNSEIYLKLLSNSPFEHLFEYDSYNFELVKLSETIIENKL